MGKSKEQSAIDEIYEISAEIKQIKQMLTVMDANIKLLYNQNNKMKNAGTGPSAQVPTQNAEGHLIKLYGKIKNQNQKPLENVYVKIFSARGELVKARTTNADGYWEARVPPGAYSVELNASHINKNIRPQNFNVEVDETMNDYEVATKRNA